MKFDGHHWRRSYVVIDLPATGLYVCFGRMCKPSAKGAVKTNHKWRSDYPKLEGLKGEYVWAKPLPISGWSLTNMAYGKPTFRNSNSGAWKIYRMPMYLMHGGYFYTASYGCSETCYKVNKKKAEIPAEIIQP